MELDYEILSINTSNNTNILNHQQHQTQSQLQQNSTYNPINTKQPQVLFASPACSSTSSSSNSSNVNTASTTISNNTLNSTASTSALQIPILNLQQQQQQQQQQSMPQSTSLVFSTAASFNISTNDTVFYVRESIQLLAKFIVSNSDSAIFRSVHAFAPDNLAWLWAFCDWEKPIDIDSLDIQEVYAPFKSATCGENLESCMLDNEQVKFVNVLFADAPLIQYTYRDKITIADVYKFLEHVQKVQYVEVARALFLLYFPRFSVFIENPLKKYLNIKMLKSNVGVVLKVDEQIRSLISTRYTNINEYKFRIINCVNLPSYIKTVLTENNFWNESNKTFLTGLAKYQQQMDLIEKTLKQKQQQLALKQQQRAAIESLQKMSISEQQNLLNGSGQVSCASPLNFPTNNKTFNQSLANDESRFQSIMHPQISSAKTNNYFKLLQKSTRINNDLDHISFDKKLHNEQHQHQQQQQQQQQQHNFMNELDIYEEALLNNKENDLDNEFYANQNDLNRQQVADNMQELYEYTNLNSPILNAANLNLSQAANAQINVNTNSQQQMSNQNKKANFINQIINGLASPTYEQLSIQLNKNNQLNQFNSQQQDFCGTLDELRFNANIYSPSMSSNKNMNKTYFNTPKTPNTQHFNQSVWQTPSSNISHTNNKLVNNLNRNYLSSCVTPPPSATFKSPLSVITGDLNNNNTNNGDYCLSSPVQLHSPDASFLNASSNLNQRAVNMHELTPFEESRDINRLIKHSAYLTSPRPNYSSKYRNDFSNLNQFSSNYSKVHHGHVDTRSPSAQHNNNNNQQLFFNSPKILYENDNCLWIGQLPPKIYAEKSLYSRKVFLGGLPYDANQQFLLQSLSKYGNVKLEIPGKDAKHPRVSSSFKTQERSTPGYVYIIFDQESAVQKLLADCRKEIKNGGEHFYYAIYTSSQSNTRKMGHQMHSGTTGKTKEVEVIPWNQEDTSYVPQNKLNSLPTKIDSKLTIFVGALHGMLSAHGLARIMNDVFGEVIHAGLDTDKYKYPIGSGRVTFKEKKDYIKAIKAKYVSIKANQQETDPNPKFEKTIQIDPYLEDAKCCKCNNKSVFFCRSEICLDYYCAQCWSYQHDLVGGGSDHNPISRQNKPSHG